MAPTPTPDYGFQLQVYAYDYFKDNIDLEFKTSLRKWKIHIRTIVQCTREASELQLKYLQDVRKEMQKTSLLEDLALLALSLLGGAAISFVSGYLQYNVGQRVFGPVNRSMKTPPKPSILPKSAPATPPNKPPQVSSIKIPNPPPLIQGGKGPRVVTTPMPPLKYTQTKPQPPNLKPKSLDIQVPKTLPKPTYPGVDSDFSKSKSKVVGDFGGKLTGFGISEFMNWADPGDIGVRNAISVVPTSVNIDAFETNMQNVWDTAEDYCETATQNYADLFKNDSGWGERFWSQLKSGEFKGAPTAPGQEWSLMNFGKQKIRDLAFEQRKKWASDIGWFYFANEPKTISNAHAKLSLEAELWALWIRSENFQNTNLAWRGSSGIPIELIVDRLAQLGVVRTNTDWEVIRRRIADQGGAPLLPVELNDVNEAVGVSDDQVLSILNWAWNRPITLIGGNHPSIPRVLTRDLPTAKQAPTIK